MTDEERNQRIHHYMYTTNEGIAEHAERIVALEEENAKLVSVLHELEDEAILAFNSLREDCETITSSSQHFFDKWWHVECDVDHLKDENTMLSTLVSQMYRDMQRVLDMSTDTVFVDTIGTLRDKMDWYMQVMANLGMPPVDYEKRMRELGIEVDA
mgnify:CR=1 FL=1